METHLSKKKILKLIMILFKGPQNKAKLNSLVAVGCGSNSLLLKFDS